MDVPKTIKVTASVLSVIGVVFVSAFFMEDRYQKVADAKEMIVQIEKASVDTFQKQQEYTDTQQKILELQILDILKERYNDVERRLENNSTSVYLKNQLERLKNKIRRLEDRLY